MDKVDKFEPFISYSDKAPIIDGYFNIYKNEQQKVENFFAQIPVQVKGTASDKDYYFRIGREHVDAYKQLGGIVFFKVIVNETTPTILYAILSLDRINELQKQSTKEIRIDLNEVPTDPQKFETEIFAFASKRNGEKVETSSPKEIADLVKGFENIRKYLGEIKDNEVQYDLESLLDSIKNTKDDGTIGWRDKFIYYSRKALDLANTHLKGHFFESIQYDFGVYLYKQKQFHLAEVYFVKTLEELRKREEVLPLSQIKIFVANTIVCLAVLNKGLNHNEDAEQKYNEALEIYRELAKTNREAYIGYVAMTFNNLAIMHFNLTRYDEAEKEYKEALEIYRELAKTNREAYNADVAMTLNNLGVLHKALSRYEEAEEEYNEALMLRCKLAKTNRDAYIGDVAQTLNGMAILHASLKRYSEAEQEYLEALKIRSELADANRDAYIADFAGTLNNLASLHDELNRKEEADQEYQEALNIYRELVKKNRDVYLDNLVKILYNIASLRKDEKRLNEARDAANEALGIYKELANKYPQIWSKDVEKTQRLLDCLGSS